MVGFSFRCFAGSSGSPTSNNGTCKDPENTDNTRIGQSAAEQYWERNVLGIHMANTEEGIEAFNRYLVLWLKIGLAQLSPQLKKKQT